MQKLKYIGKLALLLSFLLGAVLLGANLYARHAVKILQEVEENLKNSVVELIICTPEEKSCTAGSGFVVKRTNLGSYIVSNKHVCSGAIIKNETYKDEVHTFYNIKAKKRNGITYDAQVLRLAQNSDLCLVYTRGKFDGVLKLAHNYVVNEPVKYYGFPSRVGELGEGKIVKVVNNAFFSGTYSEANLKIWFGASGSPIINSKGEVIGVVTGLLSDEENGYKDRSKVYGSLFVPLDVLREFIGGI